MAYSEKLKNDEKPKHTEQAIPPQPWLQRRWFILIVSVFVFLMAIITVGHTPLNTGNEVMYQLVLLRSDLLHGLLKSLPYLIALIIVLRVVLHPVPDSRYGGMKIMMLMFLLFILLTNVDFRHYQHMDSITIRDTTYHVTGWTQGTTTIAYSVTECDDYSFTCEVIFTDHCMYFGDGLFPKLPPASIIRTPEHFQVQWQGMDSFNGTPRGTPVILYPAPENATQRDNYTSEEYCG